MKTVNVDIDLYEYKELSEKAKAKAFDEHFDFLCSVAEDGETDESIWDSVEESIEANEYLFFADGKMAHITHFVDGHPKSGKTEFYFQGKTYEVEK